MPTTINETLSAAGLKSGGMVPWGTKPAEPAYGVYIVSLTDSKNDCTNTLVNPPLKREAFTDWLQYCPQLTLDGARPTEEQLMDRIQRFWLPDEVILYIGLASSLSSRIGQYYRTPIGASKPHSGGYFLKLLSNLPELYVHYATTSNPAESEYAMLQHFTEAASAEARENLIDPSHPFPFANLEWPRGTRKQHGLSGVREDPATSGSPGSTSDIQATQATQPKPIKSEGSSPTQRVTVGDINKKQIRIPSTNTSSTKRLFPRDKGYVKVILRGQPIDSCSWDPKMGPDRQRSGVLRVGSVLSTLVRADEVLSVRRGDGDTILID
jgi:hypothetical protein